MNCADLKLDAGAEVRHGAHCFGEIRLGVGATIHAGSIVVGPVEIGPGAQIGPGAVVGTEAEHTAFLNVDPHTISDTDRWVVIGRDAILCAGVTVNKPTCEGIHNATRVGFGCYLMAKSHVGHDAILGKEVILSTGSEIGGHARIHDCAQVGLNAAIHQHAVVGEGAMIAMVSAVHRDVWPYTRWIAGECADVNAFKIERYCPHTMAAEVARFYSSGSTKKTVGEWILEWQGDDHFRNALLRFLDESHRQHARFAGREITPLFPNG